tara:strand:+ start:690 stop:968 length:279 start_codon:yes stop_codon:yes gene_type:complete
MMMEAQEKRQMKTKPLGRPSAKPLRSNGSVAPFDGKECPRCGCRQLMEIEVEVKNTYLKGGVGTGYYIGCPACPFASKMFAVAHTQNTEVDS